MPASYDGLNKRVVRLEAEYKPLLEQSGHMIYGWDTSDMTAEERQAWRALSTPIANRYLVDNGRLPKDLRELTQTMTQEELKEAKQLALQVKAREEGNER